MTTFHIHPQIEVGTITDTLCAFNKELACKVGDLFLTARLIEGRFVLSGGLYGEHSLDARASITSAERLVAHWRGYVENNGGSL